MRHGHAHAAMPHAHGHAARHAAVHTTAEQSMAYGGRRARARLGPGDRWGVALTHIGTIREGDTHDKDTRQISRHICTERELKSDDRKQLKLPGTAGPLPSCAAE